MILGNEAPIAGVKRVVSVVSHHKVVILLESIGTLSESFFNLSPFIARYNPFVKRQVLFRKLHGYTLLRDPKRSE